jgi:hypothetical protein
LSAQNPLAQLSTHCTSNDQCFIKYGLYCMQGYCQRPNEYRLPIRYCSNDNHCSYYVQCVDGVCIDANYTPFNFTNYIYSIDKSNRIVITSFGTYKFSRSLVDYPTAKTRCLLMNSTLFYPINQTEFDIILSIVYQLDYWFWVKIFKSINYSSSFFFH